MASSSPTSNSSSIANPENTVKHLPDLCFPFSFFFGSVLKFYNFRCVCFFLTIRKGEIAEATNFFPANPISYEIKSQNYDYQMVVIFVSEVVVFVGEAAVKEFAIFDLNIDYVTLSFDIKQTQLKHNSPFPPFFIHKPKIK